MSLVHKDSALFQSIKDRRKKSRATKSAYRLWMEERQHVLRELIRSGEMSWVGLEEMLWKQGFRTAQGTRVTSAMLNAAWVRIEASARMTERNYTESKLGKNTGHKAQARVGQAPTSFEITTLGKSKT